MKIIENQWSVVGGLKVRMVSTPQKVHTPGFL